MKVSTKGRYSVRLMIDLVLHGERGPVFLKDISRRQEISEKYLGHLVPLLKSAGLVRTVRGAKGGISLAREPRKITLRDIVEAVEGQICLVGCAQDPAVCKRSGRCAAQDVWAEASNAIIQIFESYSLENLAERHRSEAFVDNYVI